MNRRQVLALAVSTALGSAAGCSGPVADDGGPEETTQPPETSEPPNVTPRQPGQCPVSQALDVDVPEELTTDSVESFVEAYENAYYRDVVVAYEPETRFDAYELSAWVRSVQPRDDDAYVVDVEGSGGVYRPDLLLGASVVEDEPDADVASIDAIDGTPLADVVRRSADNPDEDQDGQIRHGPAVDEYASTVDDLPGEGQLGSKGDSVTRYVDVDGTTVELTVSVSQLHGDYWWGARYYVDETVLRRSEDDEVPPEEGQVLECPLRG